MRGSVQQIQPNVNSYRILASFWNIWFIFGFVLLPFVWWPWALIPFEIPRVLATLGYIDFLFFLSLLRWSRGKQDFIHIPKTIGLFGILFLLWVVATSLGGGDIEKSMWGNVYRRDGLLTFFHLILFGAITAQFWFRSLRTALSIALVGSGSFLAAIAFVQAITYQFFIPTGATFGQPNFLAGYLAISAPCIAWIFFRENATKIQKYVSIVCALLYTCGIVVTQSWGSWLGIVISIVGVFFLADRNHKVRFFRIGLGVGVIACVVSFIAYYPLLQIPVSTLAESRPRIIMKGLDGWSKRPMIGYGWANFDLAFQAGVWPYPFSVDVYVDKAHSHILELLATTGIVGLALAGVLFFFFVKYVYLSYSAAEQKDDQLWILIILGVCIVYIVHTQTNVTSIAEELVFWFFVGSAFTSHEE